MKPLGWPTRYRLPLAVAAAYLAGFVVELGTGGSRLEAVGWRDPWLPLAVEGFVGAALVGGWIGFLFAPAPFLLTPETVQWVWDALQGLRREDSFLAYAALFYLVPLFVVLYAGGLAGALAGWAVWRRQGRRERGV
ncbi:MAG: hypothetical protein C4304_06530 [candidate division GAL15 bacterium]